MNDTEKYTTVIKILQNFKNQNILNKFIVFIKRTAVASVLNETLCIETVFSQIIDANTSRPIFYIVLVIFGTEFPSRGNALSPFADHEHKCLILFHILYVAFKFDQNCDTQRHTQIIYALAQ